MTAVDWDRIARLYPLQHRLEAPALRAAVELAGVAPTDSVLDVATGTGAWLRQLARSGARPARVDGVDGSAAMLRHVRGVPASWRTEVADATALPFEDGVVDVVAACYLLHVVGVSSRARILAEVHRVLVPGGRLVTVTPGTLGGGGSPIARVLAALGRRRGATRTGLRPLDPREAMQNAGFTPTRVVHVARGYPSLVVLAIRR